MLNQTLIYMCHRSTIESDVTRFNIKLAYFRCCNLWMVRKEAFGDSFKAILVGNVILCDIFDV